MTPHEFEELNHHSATEAWLKTIQWILYWGKKVSPRGMLTKEIVNHQVVINMKVPVVRNVKRGIGYRFMAAEAYWICSGDNQLKTIAPYALHMADFSDDGETLAGAYGPRIVAQLPYVLAKLLEESTTRQAVLTTWQPSPAPSKDIPCTVSMTFQLRPRAGHEHVQQLHNHVFMRSSDAWLGLPYDIFSFSMVAMLLCNELNVRAHAPTVIEPGNLYLTMASSHLYELTWDGAAECLKEETLRQQPIPEHLYTQGKEFLLNYLQALRDAGPAARELRWWTHP